MWQTIKGVWVGLALITPGVALLELQQWTPVILAAAGMAGTALALAGVAFQKAQSNAARMTHLERSVPRLSTDTLLTPPPSGVPATRGATGHAAVVDSTTATLPLAGGQK